MKRATYDFRPDPVVAIGNGNYFYHWDIQEEKMSDLHSGIDGEQAEEVTKYTCYEATIIGEVTYDKCVEAVIRKKYTLEEEFALNTKYNSYLNSVTTDSTGLAEYDEYLKYVTDAKLMVKSDLELEEQITLARQKKLNDISAYDKSDNVNSFSINGQPAWLDRETRMSVYYSTNQEKAEGNINTTVWLGGMSITLSCDNALAMLSQLEVYAKKCYNRTAEHKAAVMTLSSVEDIEAYDYTTGYPEKLNFQI